MKILLINNFHYRKGGSETVYFNTAETLRAHGHEVLFFSCIDKKNEPAQEASFFAKGFRGKCSPVDIVRYFYNHDAKEKLEALLKEFQPDIADIHLFWGNLTASILPILKRKGIPVVHTVHDYRMICPAYTFTNGSGEVCHKEECKMGCILKKCCKGSILKSVMMQAEFLIRKRAFPYEKYFDALIFVSHFAEQLHKQCCPTINKIYSKVVYNCTSDPKVDFVTEKEGKYFLYYGRLSKEKGVETLLKAYTDERKYPLHIVGSGPMDEHLRLLAKGKKNVSFLGYMSGERLRQEIAGARAVIVPSEWYENNPLTIIESYSMHVPIIGARIGGIPEIIEESRTGFLFDAFSKEDLKRAIVRCETLDKDSYAQLCSNAYALFNKNFTEHRNYEGLMEVFNHILEGKK
ncbi:MAG: glycosyltransferase [Alistipes sp.]|nr:glycosyltransferase [Candidatus Alistipes equi]